jgi:hypothetical protein
MEATKHAIWAILLIATPLLVLAKFGKRPKSLDRPLIAFVFAFWIGCLGFSFTYTKTTHGEGSQWSDIHLLVYFIGSWLLLTFIESKKSAILLTAGFFACVSFYSMEYLTLADSSHYTDYPQNRLIKVKQLNEARQQKGLAPIKNVQVKRAWHTFLTGLYQVEPPAGSTEDFLDLGVLPHNPKHN